MLNLLIHSNETAWESAGTNTLECDRFLEYTTKDLCDRFAQLDNKAIASLKEIPALFAYERHRSKPARLGRIIDIKVRGKDVRFEYTFYPNMIASHAAIEEYSGALGINERFELNRTHWAIKDIDVLASGIFKASATPSQLSKRVFVVHGHDHSFKNSVAELLSSLGLEPVVLHLEPDKGRTVIEKFEQCADVGFAVILLTPDDPLANGAMRARQNVVLELGYFIGKLGRARMCALKRGHMEMPSDIFGVLFKQADETCEWRGELIHELRAAGYNLSNSHRL